VDFITQTSFCGKFSEVSLMNAQYTSALSISDKNFLQRSILGNAAFSGFSGLIMVLAAGPISQLLSLDNPIFMVITGLVLLAYMPLLVWLSNQNPVPVHFAWEVIALDVLWVIGSLILIFSDLVPLTSAGKWAVAITADIVFVFALLQYVGLRRQQTQTA
jgi:hypothetical protein